MDKSYTAMSTKSAAKLFQAARTVKGLTQVEVAQRASIHINTYARIERGEQNPTFQTAKKIAKVLDLNLADIPV